MRGNEFLDKMELIDPVYIEAADASKVKKLGRVEKFSAVAACIVLMLSLGFGTYAYAAEVKEYNDAVRFFDEYDLSTEGLTRTEIKSVYNDIENKNFTYYVTNSVIANNIDPDKIKDYKIPTENATPEEVEEFWNYRNSFTFDITPVETPIETPAETDGK